MRRGATAVIGSLVAHGVGFGIAATLVETHRWVALAPAVKPPAKPKPIEITVVTLLPEEETAKPALATSRGRGVPEHGRSESAPAPAPAPAPMPLPGQDGPARPTGSMSLHMRGASLRLSEGDLENLVDRPEGSPSVPHAPHVSGKLESAPGGTAVIHDRVTTVTVERDGTAHFRDQPDVDIHFHLPDLGWLRHPDQNWRDLKNEIGTSLRDWYRDPYAQMRRATPTELPQQDHAVPGLCDQWGDRFCQADAPPPPPNPLADGKADLTAYLMRKFHAGDPYGVRKRALLDDTFEERAIRGAGFRDEQLARSAEIMHRHLEELWAATADAAARKSALFELWDDCAEGEGPIGAAGERARAVVIGWIRARLPPGRPGAFDASDIATLSARRTSRQPFEPYLE